jgi:anti-sigma factor ChrR (cupin superfamily)
MRTIPMKRPPPALDPDILDALADASPAVAPDAGTAARIREKLFQRVHAPTREFVFVHSHQGEWVRLLRGVEIKLLREDAGSRSYLLRMAPGARVPPHAHPIDEECIVLEGDATINGVLCRAGDYHLAPQDMPHQWLSSEAGCVLFIRGGHDARAPR